MKTFFNKVMSLLEALGKARAATALSRAGLHEQARALMLDK